jgi:hypothetical protein
MGAIAANEVLPLPIAPGASLVAEGGAVGFEVGFHSNPATYCDDGGEEESCGWLLIAEAGPRLRWSAGPWAVYMALKAQALRMTRSGAWQPGIAPRLGVTFQAHRVGLFAEAGPTFVLGHGADAHRLIGIDGQRTLPAGDVGLRF